MDSLRMHGRYLNEERISEFLGDCREIKVYNSYGICKSGTMVGLNSVSLTLCVDGECVEIPLLDISRITKI